MGVLLSSSHSASVGRSLPLGSQASKSDPQESCLKAMRLPFGISDSELWGPEAIPDKPRSQTFWLLSAPGCRANTDGSNVMNDLGLRQRPESQPSGRI